ncbi:hypothetical protein EG834_14320, partial [bacterium]|nr:hypothetical protein [bacterium]
NILIFIAKRDEILADIRRINKQILLIEILCLLFFTAFLLVRLGNPDLWHPYKGGEKPMDFSYLNAVIKSTTYPPYDPWFAGGYINYYYYGFMLAGTLVKLLGIVPATAYNLILPTFFAFLGIGAFSLGWNLLARSPGVPDGAIKNRPLVSGLITSAVLLFLGNQGTVRMIWSGFQRLVAPGNVEEAGFFQRWIWFFQGIPRFFTGATLPYSPGDWYWIPSRAIPNEPITEFPLFTFLYADPHAHLFALPLTAMALAWALSILRGKWQWGTDNRHAFGKLLPTFFLGGVVIGALRPTNTWDFPTYLVIGAAAVLYTAGRYALDEGQSLWRRLLVGVTGTVGLVGLAFFLYQPFASWYGQGYNAVDWWQGDHTPVGSYLTHWGLFLFILVSWFTAETIDWMAKTPLSALNRL